MIYLDNAATTKPFESVIRTMNAVQSGLYFNPTALYKPAYAAADAVEKARNTLATAVGGCGKIRFTSCATESNTWVYTCGAKNKRGNIVVSMGEHASGYENAQALIGKGYDVRFVKLQADGKIDFNDYLQKTDENTTLVSVIHCSNETGAVNDIRTLAKALKSKSPAALMHSDGVQALGKVPVNCRDMGVDLYSISAHKIGGPKGIGALWMRDGLRLNPLLHGGGQEGGERSGTENVAGILGFEQAWKEFSQTDTAQIAAVRTRMKDALLTLPDVQINESQGASPFILSCSIGGVKAEVLQRILAEQDILIGLGSACSSRLKKNRVLSAMGQPMSRIEGSIRISFSSANLHDDLDTAIESILQSVRRLREQSSARK